MSLLSFRLVLAIVALGVGAWTWHWRKQSRAAWRAYDQEHGDGYPPLRQSRAANRAKREH